MKIVTVGRSSSNNINISDPLVSRTHCQFIQEDDGRVKLIDINSSNGTYVNGVKRHGEVWLVPSDIVRIGNTTLPWQNYFINQTIGDPATPPYPPKNPNGYKRVDSENYFTKCFSHYADFSGRARRSEYWTFYLINLLIISILQGIGIASVFSNDSEFILVGGFSTILAGIYSLVIFLPQLAVAVRRLHDSGKSGAMILLNLIPIIGGIIVFVFMCMDSEPGPNEYGPNPKGVGNSI